MLTPLALIIVMVVAPFYWIHENPITFLAIAFPAFWLIRRARRALYAFVVGYTRARKLKAAIKQGDAFWEPRDER